MKKIADGVAALDLLMDFGNRQMVIHPTLLWDDEHVVLVDTGFPGMLGAIQHEMKLAGVSFDRLTTVILTHQDFDHVGGLPEIRQSLPKSIEVIAHEVERPYIEGDKMPIKHNPSRGEPLKSKVDMLAADGEVLPYAGGLTVIFTPGHTPGHISLYHGRSKTLITGDAIVSDSGTLTGPNEQMTKDVALAWDSIARFADFDVSTVVCYHGGLCDTDVNRQFANLVASR